MVKLLERLSFGAESLGKVVILSPGNISPICPAVNGYLFQIWEGLGIRERDRLHLSYDVLRIQWA